MKIELSQEGSPAIGDTIVYCGPDTWCWQAPKAKTVYTEYPVHRDGVVRLTTDQHKAMVLSLEMSILAMIVAILAFMRASRRSKW